MVYKNMRCLPEKKTSSLLIGGGLFLSKSDSAEMEHRNSTLRSVDFEGACVLPGFIDAHTHFLQYCLKQEELDFNGISSLEACLGLVRERASQVTPGTWIKGSGWNQNLWNPSAYPTRQDLDRVAPNHPVALEARDAHTSWVNSRALELAGIDRHTPWGSDGAILKDSAGEPTGVLKEEARRLIWNIWGTPDVKERIRVLEKYQHLAFSNGLTGIHCMETIEDFEVYQTLRLRDQLKLRVTFYFPVRYLDQMISLGLRSGFGDDRLRMGGVKIFLDGTLGSQTAHLIEPYEESSNYGMELLDDATLGEIVCRATEHGIACAIHAIGDMANRKALNAFEKVFRKFPNHGLRHRIEHCQLIHPEDLRRFAALGVVASMQPIHIPEDIDTANRCWGSRSKHAFAFRSLLSSGAVLAFGSDVPIETCNVFEGLAAAVLRTKRGEKAQWMPEQRISVTEAVHGFTVGPAYASGMERRLGTIAVGKSADFMVISQDIFDGNSDIGSTKVHAVVVNGEIVFQR